MFYSKVFLSKKGKYGYIWLAAHSSFQMHQKLGKKEIYDTNILEAAGSVNTLSYLVLMPSCRLHCKCGRSPTVLLTHDVWLAVDAIQNPFQPLALRMSGHLLLGVVRLFSHKVNSSRHCLKFLSQYCRIWHTQVEFLFNDSNEAFSKIKKVRCVFQCAIFARFSTRRTMQSEILCIPQQTAKRKSTQILVAAVPENIVIATPNWEDPDFYMEE